MSMVQQAIEVGAPLHTVYENLATFENYPRFMTGVERVTPIGADRTHWVMDVDGHTREFDATITERSFDQRLSWSTTDGPLMAETLTLRPMGDTRTQVVAQLEADIAFLLPSDRHGRETLSRRLKDDLTTFKNLVEHGELRTAVPFGGASTKQLTGRSGTLSRGARPDPAVVATRIGRRVEPQPGAGWGTGAGDMALKGTNVDITSAPGISSAHDLDDVLPAGRRISTRPARGAAGSAPLGGRLHHGATRVDGMVHEEERGSAHDF